MGVSKITTTTDQRKERRQRRLKAKLCSREAEREKEQTEKADDEEIQIKRQQIINKLAARLTELEKSKEERLRQLEVNRKKALRTQLKRLTRLVEEKADSEIFLNRMLALYGKGNPQDRESELKSFTYHVRDFNRAWYTLPGTLEGQGKRVRVCEFHCRQIINRNKDERVEV